MEVKKGNGLIVFIVFLLLIIIGLSCYICYDKGIIFSKKTTNEQTNNTNNQEENTNNQQTTTEDVLELDLTKSLNTTGKTYHNASDKTSDYGLSMKINNDKTVTLTIDWKVFGKYSTTSSSGEVKDYIINGFTKNIKSTFIGELGQDYHNMTFFYLMEDGTVEYTRLFKKAENNNTDGSIYYVLNNTIINEGKYAGEFKTSGALNDVSNVIKLYNSTVSGGPNTSGYSTTIGATKDGSFYDLGSIIN